MARKRRQTDIMKQHYSLIFGAYDPQILALLAEYNTDETHLNEGKALYEAVIQLDDARHVELSEEVDASSAWKRAYEEEKAYYRKVRSLVKPFAHAIAGMAKKLYLTGSAPRKQMDLIRHIDVVYRALVRHPDFLAQMGVTWLTVESLQARIAVVQALPSLQTDYLEEHSESVEATRVRNVKYRELSEFSKFLKVKALAALEDHPFLLARLGLKTKA